MKRFLGADLENTTSRVHASSNGLTDTCCNTLLSNPEMEPNIMSKKIVYNLYNELRSYPFDWHEATERLDKLLPDTSPAAYRDAVLASVLPGAVLTVEDADAIVALLERFIDAAAAHQDQKQQAFAEAQRLMDLHGEDDLRTMQAVLHAVELANPGCINGKLKECGVHLPAPSHHTEDGAPLFSLDAVAEALDADPEELMDTIEDLEDAGLYERPVAHGKLQ